ncbi:oxidoreductase [Anaerobacillus isosaccharinicus]|uniref:SDR family oxidoreductase n=1 Tax=Anaerobacillus isosaccharinicus TaxID=1532552 RepID=A0A1S2L4P2_9BACI|nr:oxidoreductase [Anaerobacillus isosaccharinicus]MBA5585933.1 SDR family oxidoreductase [Anaerobacillus isosaccharinicus]QOY35779.1 SDR family oxidoreductase [Anaerobacillus isosaccharinicus]
MFKQDLIGKTSIVTGANSGIGLEAARILANRGAQVILAVRNQQKGEAAVASIQAENSEVKVEVMRLDLSDLTSIHSFAQVFIDRFDSLDLLINNAGVMVPPYEKTKDGFELQFGSNHLGHFALTGLLLPLLKKTPSSRVVTLSSIAHRGASIYFDNLDGSNGYKPMKFYKQSKLANLLFAKELDERFKENSISTISLACHPGITSTNLFKIGKKEPSTFMKNLLKWLFQSVEKGVLPTIYAATETSLIGGEYIGPDGRGNRTGNPTIEIPAEGVYNKETMKQLWEVSERLTGVFYDFS